MDIFQQLRQAVEAAERGEAPGPGQVRWEVPAARRPQPFEPSGAPEQREAPVFGYPARAPQPGGFEHPATPRREQPQRRSKKKKASPRPDSERGAREFQPQPEEYPIEPQAVEPARVAAGMKLQLNRENLRQAIILADVLGPPPGLRDD